jgi:short-subunit dehydrogenase
MKQWALVTGASSGIGLHLAECFAKDGISLVLSARNEAKLSELAADFMSKYKVDVVVVSSDLSKPNAATELISKVKAHNIELTYLVNNAGVGTYGLFENTPIEATTSMLRLNMEALTVLCSGFMPDLLKTRGKILNVASTAAFQPGPYMAAYYATKAYVLSFSEALAEELADKGVAVCTLCPGPTASGFQAEANMQKSALVQGKRMPSSEDVAVKGYAAMKRNQRVYIHGALNWTMAQSIRFTPRSWATKVVKFISKPVA